ncbi:MAG: hypothetical protein WBA42_18115 [Mesorhizobium sp.]
MKFIFLFAALVVLSSPACANPARLQRLQSTFENFEAGFAWLKHCGDFKKSLAEKPFYMANAQLVVVALDKEITVEHPQITPQQAQQMIFARRQAIQSAFDAVYGKGGCGTPQAEAAKKQVDLFGSASPEKINDFLKTIENL